MAVNFEGNSRLPRFAQLRKALPPIEVRLSGKLSLVKEAQSSKALDPMEGTPSLNTISSTPIVLRSSLCIQSM